MVRLEPDMLIQNAMKKTRVLVIEADSMVSDDLEGRLSRLGCEVAGHASTSEEAIDRAGDMHPDVVLVNVELDSDPHGIDTARSLQRKLKLPIIYLSARSGDTTVIRARVTGPFGFVQSAFDEPELKVAIEMAVHRYRTEMERDDLVQQLESALARVKALNGLVPICAECKQVRDELGYWSQVEAFIEQHTKTRFTHCLCPVCYQKAVEHHHEDMRKKRCKKATRAPRINRSPGHASI